MKHLPSLKNIEHVVDVNRHVGMCVRIETGGSVFSAAKKIV
jgi:hypothetical protein